MMYQSSMSPDGLVRSVPSICSSSSKGTASCQRLFGSKSPPRPAALPSAVRAPAIAARDCTKNSETSITARNRGAMLFDILAHLRMESF
jgi:hypothetical protein